MEKSRTGPRILLGTAIGYAAQSNIDLLLGAALTLRGVECHLLLCDRAMPACFGCTYGGGPDKNGIRPVPQCESCYPGMNTAATRLGLPIHRYSREISPGQLETARKVASQIAVETVGEFTYQGWRVGEQALAGAIRYFASTEFQHELQCREVLKRYLEGAMIAAFVVENLIGRHRYQTICGTHGIYVPQGMLNEVARASSVRVVNWLPGYKEKSLIFSNGHTYHRTMLSEPVENWSGMKWSRELETEIMEYLESRETGKYDWISFNRNPNAGSWKRLIELGLSPEKPVIGLLSNVTWDAQLHYGPGPFADMIDWVQSTIDFFAARPNLQLLIRVHPAELTGNVKSRQPLVESLKKSGRRLPSNVFIIPPEDTTSTYEATSVCDSVLIYATKTGIELAARGIPVIVAGEAWIKDKGFAVSPHSRSEYFSVLEQLPLNRRMDEAELTRARKYAYHFFMRKMIPLPFLDSKCRSGLKSLEELMPGNHPGLDLICDDLIHGGDFIYRSELRKS